MLNLVKTSTLLIVSACLIGCASGPTPYQAIGSGNSVGFQDMRIENDRFRVAYTANSPDEAHDFALLRAAEIAKAEGYSHFQIVNGRQTVKGGGSGIRPHLGVGLRTGGYRGLGTSIGVGVPLDLDPETTRQSFEIKLHAAAGNGPDFFSADEVIFNLSNF